MYCKAAVVKLVMQYDDVRRERRERGRRKRIWMSSGRTTEEVDATNCSSVAGRDRRGEIMCGCKKRNERKGNVAEKNS